VADLMSDNDLDAHDAQLIHRILTAVDQHMNFTMMKPHGTIRVHSRTVTITINFTFKFGNAFYDSEEYEGAHGLDVEYATEAAEYLKHFDVDAIVKSVASIHQ
jgi:hypothetical protein